MPAKLRQFAVHLYFDQDLENSLKEAKRELNYRLHTNSDHQSWRPSIILLVTANSKIEPERITPILKTVSRSHESFPLHLSFLTFQVIENKYSRTGTNGLFTIPTHNFSVIKLQEALRDALSIIDVKFINEFVPENWHPEVILYNQPMPSVEWTDLSVHSNYNLPLFGCAAEIAMLDLETGEEIWSSHLGFESSNAYVIELYFDENLENHLTKARDQLHERIHNPKIVKLNRRPHVRAFSSTEIEPSKIESILKNLAYEQDIIPIDYRYISVKEFKESNHLAILSWQRHRVIQFQKKLCQKLKEIGIETPEEYDTMWTLSVSVARDIPQAKDRCIIPELKLSAEGHVTGIGLVKLSSSGRKIFLR